MSRTLLILLISVSILILGVAIAGLIFYSIVINPEIEKPIIEKPPLIEIPQEEIENPNFPRINEGHIDYLLNELGFYSLHKHITTGELPMINTAVININKEYFSVVRDNNIETVESSEGDVDIKIRTNQDVLISLWDSETPAQDANDYYESGDIEMEILKSQEELALKGYLVIYENFFS